MKPGSGVTEAGDLRAYDGDCVGVIYLHGLV